MLNCTQVGPPLKKNSKNPPKIVNSNDVKPEMKILRVDYGFKGEVFLRNGNGILLPNNQFGSSIYKLKHFFDFKIKNYK